MRRIVPAVAASLAVVVVAALGLVIVIRATQPEVSESDGLQVVQLKDTLVVHSGDILRNSFPCGRIRPSLNHLSCLRVTASRRKPDQTIWID